MAVPIFYYFYWVFSIFPLALHCFVTSFLIRQRYQKNKTYTSPFYLIYIFASFADMGNMINSNFLNRFTPIESLETWAESHPLFYTIVFLISGYCIYSQAFYHAAVAINRIWVSYFPMKDGNKAIKKLGNYIIWFLPILPILILSPRFSVTMVYLDAAPGEIAFAVYNETWVKNYHAIAGPTIVLSSSSLSFILTLLAIRRYRILLQQVNSNNNGIKREIYLLGHATVTLFFEILVCCYYGAVIVSNTYKIPRLFPLVAPIVDYIIDLSSFVNPISLLIICKFIREDFKEFLLKLFGKIINKVTDISSGTN